MKAWRIGKIIRIGKNASMFISHSVTIGSPFYLFSLLFALISFLFFLCFLLTLFISFFIFFFSIYNLLRLTANTRATIADVQCQDTSRYCANVMSMGLCKLHRYQQKCCKSCRIKIYNN